MQGASTQQSELTFPRVSAAGDESQSSVANRQVHQQQTRRVSVRSPANDQPSPLPPSIIDEKSQRRRAQKPKPVIKPAAQLSQNGQDDDEILRENATENPFRGRIGSQDLVGKSTSSKNNKSAKSTTQDARQTRSKTNQKESSPAVKGTLGKEVAVDQVKTERRHHFRTDAALSKESDESQAVSPQIVLGEVQPTQSAADSAAHQGPRRKAAQGRQPTANSSQRKSQSRSDGQSKAAIDTDTTANHPLSQNPGNLGMRAEGLSRPQITREPSRRTYGSQRTTDLQIAQDSQASFVYSQITDNDPTDRSLRKRKSMHSQ
ncbi:hypothetical protein B0T14DRAFT_525050 [Immersiella caudata]|uniref:Uncharacterized protein n=1 Tax=Immersiella caudata TaxID=314043 RepID=A0AA39WL17_9PEZI|nr:hypothetical protein B0T14DRAFT_525050 [Immersiella caudata]